MFKNMKVVILFDMFHNPSSKMTTRLVNIAITTASTSKRVYNERFQIIRNSVFIWKVIFNYERIKN